MGNIGSIITVTMALYGSIITVKTLTGNNGSLLL